MADERMHRGLIARVEGSAPRCRLSGRRLVTINLGGAARATCRAVSLRRKRRTGGEENACATGIISIVLAIPALSGFGLFFATGDGVRAAVALLHEVIGVACLVPALAHGQARSAPAPETVPETGTTVLK